MEQAYKKPIPTPSVRSTPFWRSCHEHVLSLPRCSDCGSFHFPPAILCPECLSDRLEWARASGRGKVFSFVLFHRVYHPGFAEEVPYPVAVVAMEEGPRMLTNLVDCAPADVRCDMPVEVAFEDITDEISLPRFRPAKTI